MQRTMLKSKIHRATITDANIEYEGSVSIDAQLMEEANIIPWEAIYIWDVTNGERLMTYAIPGKSGSGVVCINGAATHKVRKGDCVILATYATYNDTELDKYEPKKIFVNEKNRMIGK